MSRTSSPSHRTCAGTPSVYDGEIQFWRHPAWSPPVPSLLLTVAYAIVVAGFVCWVLASSTSQEPESMLARQSDHRRAAEPHPAVVSPTVESNSPGGTCDAGPS
jgi:hypothetical protein